MNSNLSYSPETPNLCQNRRFLSRVTSKFGRWPWKTMGHLLYASSNFVHRFVVICEFKPELKNPNWSKIVLTTVTLTFDLWNWPFAWSSFMPIVITPENFMMIRWWEKMKKVWQTERETAWTIHSAAWSQLKYIIQHYRWCIFNALFISLRAWHGDIASCIDEDTYWYSSWVQQWYRGDNTSYDHGLNRLVVHFT